MKKAKPFIVIGARGVRIKSSPGRGRGIYTVRRIEQGVLIERCPVKTFAKDEWQSVEQSPFSHYPFQWGHGGAVAMGVTSFCNHSDDPNAEVVLLKDEGAIELVALRDIPRGDEVTISYGDNLWFDPVG